MQILKQNCTFTVQSTLIINRSKQHATCHIRTIRVQKKTYHSRVIYWTTNLTDITNIHTSLRSYVPIRMASKGEATCKNMSKFMCHRVDHYPHVGFYCQHESKREFKHDVACFTRDGTAHTLGTADSTSEARAKTCLNSV